MPIWAKFVYYATLKSLKSNATPAFYWRGYGMSMNKTWNRAFIIHLGNRYLSSSWTKVPCIITSPNVGYSSTILQHKHILKCQTKNRDKTIQCFHKWMLEGKKENENTFQTKCFMKLQSLLIFISTQLNAPIYTYDKSMFQKHFCQILAN